MIIYFAGNTYDVPREKEYLPLWENRLFSFWYCIGGGNQKQKFKIWIRNK